VVASSSLLSLFYTILFSCYNYFVLANFFSGLYCVYLLPLALLLPLILLLSALHIGGKWDSRILGLPDFEV